jgi:small-conductance mechanosensitive channel
LRAVSGIPNLSPNNESTLFYREFADSSINFILRLWVNSAEQHEYLSLGSEAIISIKKAYDANGIMIPFPITTLDFGIKGGVELKEML